MGWGPFSSDSTSSQTTTALADQAQQIQKGSHVAQGQGVLLDASKSRDLSLGNVNTEVGAGGDIVTGTQVSTGGDITITSSDADVLNKSLDKISELSSGFGSSLNQFVSQVIEDQDKKVATLLGAVEKSKESEDSAAQNRKIFLYIVLGLLALIGFLKFLGRK